MKKCNLECECQHEGYCIVDMMYEGIMPSDCKAKTNDDLITEEEYEELIEVEGMKK